MSCCGDFTCCDDQQEKHLVRSYFSTSHHLLTWDIYIQQIGQNRKRANCSVQFVVIDIASIEDPVCPNRNLESPGVGAGIRTEFPPGSYLYPYPQNHPFHPARPPAPPRPGPAGEEGRSCRVPDDLAPSLRVTAAAEFSPLFSAGLPYGGSELSESPDSEPSIYRFAATTSEAPSSSLLSLSVPSLAAIPSRELPCLSSLRKYESARLHP